VTAVSRDPAALDGRYTSTARADVFEPATVATAVAGADVVVSAAGHAASLDDAGFYVRAAESLVAALRSLGNLRPRLIVVGGFGALRTASGTQWADEDAIPEQARPEIAGQRDALNYYRTVGDIRWTYFSPPPGGIPSGTRTGSYRIFSDTMADQSRVTAEDFAVAIVDEAENAECLFCCVSVAS
jgi:putative NADH-flavin reductase